MLGPGPPGSPSFSPIFHIFLLGRDLESNVKAQSICRVSGGEKKRKGASLWKSAHLGRAKT
ncbi:rCG63165 [Rattus norvegicus]|uniref:RCG63165 n=1 Tax=Rattus norvegicus TaxID=10116 RepID=A6KKB2_RAT|nr:rCG63165 [Rattus norvegicus]